MHKTSSKQSARSKADTNKGRRGKPASHVNQVKNVNQVKSVRGLAAWTLNQVVDQQKSLNSLLPVVAEKVPAQDVSLLQEIIFGSCRWYFGLQNRYRAFLRKNLGRNDSLTDCLLIIGSYQLLYMRTPVHAAINETVEAAQELGLEHHKGLINAILRKVSQMPADETSSKQAIIESYPNWMVEKLKHNWPQHYESILIEGNARPPMTLRVNPHFADLKKTNSSATDAKHITNRYLEQLHQANLPARRCDHAEFGITLDQACSVEALPGFDSGAISIQDEAAQLCCKLLDLHTGQKVLDACAAPGGKTCAILEAQTDIDLTAIEADEQRAQRIHENLNRLGFKADVKISAAEALDQWWDGIGFDRILLDAPCSATGVIRRHPDIKLLRQETDIKALAELQLTLLQSLWKTLKPGGRLVYATCSAFPQENSRIIERFLKNEASAQLVPITSEWGHDTGFGRQLFPQPEGHDGFFYACLTKADS